MPAIYVSATLYSAFEALAVGSPAIVSLLAFDLFVTTLRAIPTNGAGAALFAGILFAAAVLGMVLDAYGFSRVSPGLIILGIFLSLIGAGVAGELVAKGASDLYNPALADYLFAILFAGGLSAGFDVGKLATE